MGESGETPPAYCIQLWASSTRHRPVIIGTEKGHEDGQKAGGPLLQRGAEKARVIEPRK